MVKNQIKNKQNKPTKMGNHLLINCKLTLVKHFSIRNENIGYYFLLKALLSTRDGVSFR
jgi:hypothetical protein